MIRSKLYPPPMPADTVRRERLLSLSQTVAGTPLTLVSAPAGYGKSTLVSQWLDLLGCKSAWLSLDNEDSELTQFLSYVVAALHDAYWGAVLKSPRFYNLRSCRTSVVWQAFSATKSMPIRKRWSLSSMITIGCPHRRLTTFSTPCSIIRPRICTWLSYRVATRRCRCMLCVPAEHSARFVCSN